ncbi:MAG: histidine kinase [Taibaiella sp.]|nr:histidine kinase [Taibaiella sp.]
MNWLTRHKTRLILNILVWLFWSNMLYNNSRSYTPEAADTGIYISHIIGYNLLYVLAVYCNTLWLMPRLLFRKKYLWYFFSLLAYISLLAIVISHYREWLLARFPGATYNNFSPVSLSGQGPNLVTEIYFPSFIALFLIVFVFFIGSLAQKFFEISKQKDAVQQKQVEMELNLLKSQINPHFLFNVLNSIYALSLKKSEQTPEIVLKLADIMRYMLYETKQDKVALHKEIQVLQDYLDIEKVRLAAAAASVQLMVDGSAANYRVAPALLIPFVENAVKHGTDSMLAEAYIHIHIIIKESSLTFHCINNYKANFNTEKKGGIGLENVRKRLKLLYPDKHQLSIDTANNIFEVRLQLNLEQ